MLSTTLFAVAEVNTTEPIAEERIMKDIAKKQVISATRGDIKVIEASENIRYLSQKMVKLYLYFYKNPTKFQAKRDLERMLLALNDDFRIIVTTTKDSDTKDILEFLAYSKDQIAEIFSEVPNEERAALMLDYSETLLEGADSVAVAHRYDFADEEKMLMVTKEMEYLLERMSKYYMALHAGFDSPTNKDAMQESIMHFEENIAKINLYAYPKQEREQKMAMNASWKATQAFLEKSETLFIPNLMNASVAHLENIVAKIALFHTQNQ